jgi:hypothetical protein
MFAGDQGRDPRDAATEFVKSWLSRGDSESEPLFEREDDGVVVGRYEPLAEGFASSDESFLRLIGARG